MTPQIFEWARRWGVSSEALQDLAKAVGMFGDYEPHAVHATSESSAQANVRIEASRQGARLWRNNVGHVETADGRHFRYGIANDSVAVNRQVKSADLIGLRPVLITSEHVGSLFGQFVAREVKRPGWKYHGTSRERAQLQFLTIVLALGGDANFSTGGY
jgi:hypothetical protein